jgi:UDP-3-O-[3-hydroxymyristoyl] glucosamine N-acyltransferase
MSTTLGDLATQLGCELEGDPRVSVTTVATLSSAKAGAICFFANSAYADALATTAASAVILRESDLDKCPVSAIITRNPYLTFARVAHVLHPDEVMSPGVHPSACVADTAQVADSAHVAANAVIEADCDIGEHVYVGPGVVIGPRCRIGDHTRLLANCTLVQDVTMGARGIIHSGAVVGSDGFGNAMSEQGWVKVKQLGGVRIGDDVEIGSNTSVDRGALGDTVLGNGVRLDNLVQIAHNVQVGDHTAMAAMTGIAGSAIIGRRCMFGGSSGTVGHITLCDDVIVSGCTMVSKDVREPGVYTGSFPAQKDKNWKQNAARFRRSGDIVNRIKALEKKHKDD